MDPKKSDTNVKAAADALMAQANEAAAIFTQYDQEQVDRIVGATFHIPHGRANAFVMIPVIRYNAALPHKFPPYPNYPSPKAKDRYMEIAAALKLDAPTPEKGVENL